MKLTENQAAHIRQAVMETFGTGTQVWLTGYHRDTNLCENAIKLLVCPDPAINRDLLHCRVSLLNQLEQAFGKYKIDITIESDPETQSPVRAAHNTSIRL